MAFTQKLPVWLASGVEPPEILKNEGWKAGIKPPDAYFNYLQNTAYLALKELQEKAAEASALTGKVDKELGKGLSTNDYTTAEKTKLGGIQAGAEKNIPVPIASKVQAEAGTDNTNFMTPLRTKEAIMKLSPPTDISGKVDKVAGKQLSTEDYTTAEKTKLSGVAPGANNYVHPATHPATMITEDPTHRFGTDTKFEEWNGKETPEGAQEKVNALAGTKSKPNGIASLGPDGKVPATELPKIANTGNDVTITDVGNYFTGVTVEAALQELGASVNTARVSMIASTNELMKG